jgi:thioredoxin reductase (NADPH)
MATKKEQFTSTADIGIIGAGPIGLELAIALRGTGLTYLQFDAKQIGHTFTWWPRNTHFFSTTERIEIAGIPIQNTTQQRTTGEEYLAYLRSIVEQLDLPVRTYEPITRIEPRAGGFVLHSRPMTGASQYHCSKVVLASGDMHRPKRLNIPGEDLLHVSHYFDDVHPYFRKRLLIVGGRNSAAEAALRCWRAGAEVTISYRRAKFDQKLIKHWILPDLETQIELGTIGYHPLTAPSEIKAGQVVLERLDANGTSTGERFAHGTDFVLLLTGFEADVTLFQSAGVALVGESQSPTFNPETMETNVPGLYVAGTSAAGKRQSRYTLFIENTHHHVGRIVQALTGQWPESLGTIPARQYDLPLEAIQDN